MRNVAAPSHLEVLAQVGGLRKGAIGILPLREQTRVLVLAFGEEVSASKLDAVVSQR